ncbi:hypothetical protein JCM8097_001168 [Rhodosporidiobolus ruineniae]
MRTSGSKQEAAYHLFVTCAGALVFFSLFALWHAGSSPSSSSPSSTGVRGAVSGSWAASKAFFSPSRSSTPRYSLHQCLGGATWDNSGHPFPGAGSKTRRCHFQNVCARLLPLDAPGMKWDTDTNTTIELTYYRDPRLGGGSTIWSTETRESEEPWLMTDRDHYLTVREVYGEMPREKELVEPPTVLMGAFWPANFGHALGDDLLPAFRLLQLFSLLRPDNYYAFHQSCLSRGGHDGCRNARALHALVTSQPYEQLGGALFPDTVGQTCFADLVLGPNELTMRHPTGRTWVDLADWMKSRIDLPVGSMKKPLKKHKVVIIEKHGRRTWLNYAEVRKHVEETYGVEALLVDPATLSVEDQLRLFDGTTVLVTPPGGVSFSSLFLREGAAAVMVEWWDEGQQRSFPMDQEVYIAGASSSLTPPGQN